MAEHTDWDRQRPRPVDGAEIGEAIRALVEAQHESNEKLDKIYNKLKDGIRVQVGQIGS